jgi:hypothetical protein
MTEITLTRKQVEQLSQMAIHFKEVDLFTITSSSESGIGPTVNVKFTLFDGIETKSDITDVDSW